MMKMLQGIYQRIITLIIDKALQNNSDNSSNWFLSAIIHTGLLIKKKSEYRRRQFTTKLSISLLIHVSLYLPTYLTCLLPTYLSPYLRPVVILSRVSLFLNLDSATFYIRNYTLQLLYSHLQELSVVPATMLIILDLMLFLVLLSVSVTCDML